MFPAEANSTSRNHQLILGLTSFAGKPVDATTVLVGYTLSGDADLNQSVDTIDFNLQANSFGQSGKNWSNGDFDHNSAVDTRAHLRLFLCLLNDVFAIQLCAPKFLSVTFCPAVSVTLLPKLFVGKVWTKSLCKAMRTL